MRKYGIYFKDKQLDGYKNINCLHPQKDQLHACETLFGDYDAKVMILAQDAANYDRLKSLKEEAPNENPFRHDESVKTNCNLYNLFKERGIFNIGNYKNPNNRSCGLYYANAIWLLKNTAGMNGAITRRNDVFELSRDIFHATIDNLNKLKIIITLGEQSFKFLKHCYPNDFEKSHWPDVALNNEINKINYNNHQYLVASTYHPGKLGLKARAAQNGIGGVGAIDKGFDLLTQDLDNVFDNHSVASLVN